MRPRIICGEMRSVPLEKKELSLQGGDPSKETKNNDER